MKGHIKLSPAQRLYDFSPVLPPVKIKAKPVKRNAHFAKVKSSFTNAIEKFNESQEFTDYHLSESEKPQHLVLTFKKNLDVNERLALSSLSSHGMSLLSVNELDGRVVANVSMPINKIGKLEEILIEYGTKDTKYDKPKNQRFIESISEIEFGDIKSLWFSCSPLTQDENEILDVELWLDTSIFDADVILRKLVNAAEKLNIIVKTDIIKFKDRLVKIVCATTKQLTELQLLIEAIAEIRPAQTISNTFLNMTPSEQHEWIEGISYDYHENLTAICILDTGLNFAHPLLKEFTSEECVLVAEPQWNLNDAKGHGTSVSGLALYGDLKIALQNKKININALLESVKILPDFGENERRLYGSIISDAVYNIESIRPFNQRIYTMAITSPYDLRGVPSSWSASIDLLCSGSPDDDTRRLFVVSGGNMAPEYIKDYPDSNITASIEDPANSWNAISVGYWASEDNVLEKGYVPLAELTDLGPSSTTSMEWIATSPFKPDVVFEGGNYGLDGVYNFAADLEELSLLTTSNDFSSGSHFNNFIETSAATAIASNFISKVWSQYPDYLPETIRALVIHSAQWPKKILERYHPFKNKQAVMNILRTAGYGYPELSKAITSGDKSVNLVIEENIQPYNQEGKMNKMALYSLPWPSEELEKLGAEEVKLRVTLSYFVEPNPGERGWENKFKYASFGLRFDFNSAGEDSQEFVARINKKFRESNPDYDIGDSDSSKWLLGPNLRTRGSIHSDIWTGTAADLADKKYIAVYPVGGWWKELKKENRQTSMARFSLIVSIETPNNNLELHNKISQLLNVETEIQNIITI
ncbi:S8 family peptidase [Pantoea sp. NPDC088449]|uniref:S8 family peptidase n=1 Tax=Pantoea sp. NPDC088449 TaxID=3364392 RepID=UPI00382C9ED0